MCDQLTAIAILGLVLVFVVLSYGLTRIAHAIEDKGEGKK